MKALVSAILFLCLPVLLIGQYQVSGTVVNEADSQPLQGASVFINNGSNGTVSDKDGRFMLSGIVVTNFELIISYINYQTMVVKITPENIRKSFRVQMQPKPQELQEVVIGPALVDGWKKWGRTFTDFFIGTSKNASQCLIKNPKVLRFRYDKKNRILKVTAADKLVIVNNALGYQIEYQLEEFRYEAKLGMTSYYGYSSYHKLSSKRGRKQQEWINNRREAYNGSLMHFIRSVYNNTTEAEGFELRQLIRLYKNDSVLRPFYDSIMRGQNTVYDTGRFSIQLMKGGTFGRDPIIYILSKEPLPPSSVRVYDSASRGLYLLFQNNLQVLYKNEFEKDEYAQQLGEVRNVQQNETSVLHLPNLRAVLVEKNGLYFDPLDLYSEGYIAWEKLAELLPSDYELGD